MPPVFPLILGATNWLAVGMTFNAHVLTWVMVIDGAGNLAEVRLALLVSLAEPAE